MAQADIHDQAIDSTVTDGGAFEVIRKRLLDQADSLATAVNGLNTRRETAYGKATQSVIRRVRVRTEHNCVPRDIARIGNQLLFGYNVFIGLKKETAVADVFATYDLAEGEDGLSISPAEQASVFTDPRFVADFQELYTYYKHTQLRRMQVVGEKLLVTFQIGADLTDIRVFRWAVGGQGEATYIDDRGERDLPAPASHDFEWQQCGREQQVLGKHPHYSIMDQVFVDTSDGQLTIKVENNTDAGYGVYSEPVDEPNQSLDDASVAYAQVSGLILIRVRAYRENVDRYLVFNPATERVVRIDAIGLACRGLPEDHGIVFPGGVYLHSDVLSRFEGDLEGLEFSRKIASPNGEDVLYTFYEPKEGRYGLLAYNLIRQELQNPIYAHGYSLFTDGKLVVFRSESTDATRNHPMQIWQTAFYDDDHRLESDSIPAELARIGNTDLVRAISEMFALVQTARNEQPGRHTFTELIEEAHKTRENHYWLDDPGFEELAGALVSLAETGEQILDEYEKVEAIQNHAQHSLRESEHEQSQLLRRLKSEPAENIQAFVLALGALRKQRGHLLSIRELRYIDVKRIDVLEAEIVDSFEQLAAQTVQFLLAPEALRPYQEEIDQQAMLLPECRATVDVRTSLEQLDAIGHQLDTLTEVLGTLQVQDATERTRILELISQLFATLNQAKAQARLREKELGSSESVAEFAAQFTLLGQSVASALGQVDSPAACDDQLSRLAVQLEELETRFGEHDQFLADILAKREELFDTFAARKQALLDEQAKRAESLYSVGERILEGLGRRAEQQPDRDTLNAFFSSDPMVQKLRELIASLLQLGDSVKADDLDARWRASKDTAFRSQRDRLDLFEGDGEVIRLGDHRFNVNSQSFELTLVQRDDQLYAQLNGTGFVQRVEDAELDTLRAYWDQSLVSESADLYRAEYLADTVLQQAQSGGGSDFDALHKAALTDELEALVKECSTARYQEGYENGVHDRDAAAILRALVPKLAEAGLLRFEPAVRACALYFWYCEDAALPRHQWHQRALSAASLDQVFQTSSAFDALAKDVAVPLQVCNQSHSFGLTEEQSAAAARYLVEQIAVESVDPVSSSEAAELVDGLHQALKNQRAKASFERSLKALVDDPLARLRLYEHWLHGFVAKSGKPALARFVPEAAVRLVVDPTVRFRVKPVDLSFTVAGLLGDHPTITDRALTLAVDTFSARLARHRKAVVPGFQRYQKARHRVAATLEQELSIASLKPRPLSSFVRNRLINEVYLPIVGSNLAKQMGTAGDSKRTDLMGLLLLISPPGYGKTTLMEYIASRLGLVFLKVNGPALGHDVKSLDPAQAPNATAAQELVRLNLGLEMGNNVMLYVDDIQHTSSEFLQKFISLCDGTRRIEGVWQGKTSTYDLRGRKFCVVMAGNPYTESGEVFKVPDMLANRADIYNLGDVLSGREDVFALSYIENALTSNPVLAPLATRSMEDVYRFVRRAQGDSVPDTEFEHSYSRAEIQEITGVLEKLTQIQEVLLAVNLEYIRSSAMNDEFRTEPPFLLQGSYRNMNKLAEKVVAIMNDAELDDLIDDHYQGEAQLLTTSAENNLLKLKELRNRLTDTEAQRWSEIVRSYSRTQSLGGSEADPGTMVASQLSLITEHLHEIGLSLAGTGSGAEPGAAEQIGQELARIHETVRGAQLNIVNQPSKAVEEAMVRMANTIETTFMPVVASMDKKIDLDLAILRRVNDLSEGIDEFQQMIRSLEADRGDQAS